jgi:hypothetical protein
MNTMDVWREFNGSRQFQILRYLALCITSSLYTCWMLFGLAHPISCLLAPITFDLVLLLALLIQEFNEPGLPPVYLWSRRSATAATFRLLLGIYVCLPTVFQQWTPRNSMPRFKSVTTLFRVLFQAHYHDYSGIIHALRLRKVRNSRDKAYALYGVLRAMGVMTPKPDYAKPTDVVFQELFTSLLTWRPAFLVLLLDAGQLEWRDSLTWVPQWDRHDSTSWLPEHVLHHDFGRTSMSRNLIEHGWPLCEVNENKLTVYGESLDTIAFVQTFPDLAGDDALLETTRGILHWLTALAIIQKQHDRTIMQNLDAALYGLLIGKSTQPYNSRNPEPSSTSFLNYLDWLVRFLGAYPTSEGTTHLMPQTNDASEVLENINESPRSRAFHEYMCASLVQTRSLFVTQQGRFGSGSSHISINDTVHNISGVPLPLVLRSQNIAGEYAVVGPAVVCNYGSKKSSSSGLRKFNLI